MSSPFIPPASATKYLSATWGDSQYQRSSDPVLHRVLDKTHRVQATPLGKGYHNVGDGASTSSKFVVTHKQRTSTLRYAFDDSPISSPEPEAPWVYSENFSSPIKGVNTPGMNRKRRTSSNRLRGTLKPGTSVLTPAKKYSGHQPVWDSDDDFHDEDLGQSPPKTMKLYIPQSRLMKTPANEAPKRIVTDLLATVGAGDLTDDIDDQSPSVIRRTERLEAETF